MNKRFKKITDKVLDYVFPSNLSCITCNRDIKDFNNFPMCDKCKDMYYTSGKYCVICNDKVNGEEIICENCRRYPKAFKRAVTPFIYSDEVANIVNAFKNRNHKYLAEGFAIAMVEKLRKKNISFDIITYMPLSAKKLKQRGYNQAKLLAEEISKLTNTKVIDAFSKVLETKEQKSLNFNERQKNLKGAFKITCNKDLLKDKKILIVDDVLTTCASINSISLLLKKYNTKVYVVAIAKTILYSNKNDFKLRKKIPKTTK